MPVLLGNQRGAKAEQRPVCFEFDLVDVGEVARGVRADGVAGGVALLISVEAELKRLGFAPFRVKDCADEVEDGGRADGQPIAFGQDIARAPVFIDDAQEFSERKIVVVVARGVGHPGPAYVVGERVYAGIEAVGRPIKLPVSGKVARFLCALDADDLALMLPMTVDD